MSAHYALNFEHVHSVCGPLTKHQERIQNLEKLVI